MYDKTVEFLAKAVTLIPQNFPDSAAVKSHLISKCRDAEYDKQVVLAKSSFGSDKLCKKCGNPWIDVQEIRIAKSKKFKHQKHLLKKKAHNGSKLSSIQKKIHKFISQKMMCICKFCKNVKFIELKSHKMLRTNPNTTITTTPKNFMSNTPQTKPKSKNRKKDVFAGLNKSIVLQSQTPKSIKGKIPKVLSETPKGIPKHNVNKLANALNKESSSGSGSSIMKLLK